MKNKIRKKIIINEAYRSGSSSSSTLTETTIDITGLSTIDLTAASGYDIINLTSTNPIETILGLTGYATNKNFTLRPAVGLTLSFADDQVTFLMRLISPSVLIDGTNYGYIEFQKRGSRYYQKQFMDSYNPII